MTTVAKFCIADGTWTTTMTMYKFSITWNCLQSLHKYFLGLTATRSLESTDLSILLYKYPNQKKKSKLLNIFPVPLIKA